MAFTSTNPANGLTSATFEAWTDSQTEDALAHVSRASVTWAGLSFEERSQYMRNLAQVIRAQRDILAGLITAEMGKLITESRAEVEKCAWVCEYYADNAAGFLANEVTESDAGRSYVAYQPLGPVLAIMPWNFPLWQVMRFAAPALMAGNTGLLKHASNVPQCALALEKIFRDAGFPEHVFRTLMITSAQTERVIADPRVKAVTLTGSCAAGRKVGAAAGMALKKCVLELGGSDAFIVLDDADLELAVKTAVTSRFVNAGQSCIAAKRFILTPGIAEGFVERFRAAVKALKPGDPMDESTTLAPLARPDLRDELHDQVERSVQAGAKVVTGCESIPGEGFFYQPSIIDHVTPDAPAYHEELFGPVAIVIRAKDEADAVRIANDSVFGLGGSVWTQNTERGERIALLVESGAVFVNGLVKSDPRLPFGGVKESGYGRELSVQGIREFVNVKTVWIR